MNSRSMRRNARLMCGAGAAAILALSSPAQAETRQFDIPAQSLSDALARFGTQSDVTVVTTTEITRARTSQAVTGEAEPEIALAQLLTGTGLTFRREGDTFLIVRSSQDPQGGSAAGGGAEVEALIVTAQKREEDIQDVPIAISAFSQEDLTTHQIAGGPDLMTQIPNFTFTKTNFTGYSIQIRGIGTQAISATTDAAVAVAFNNTPFIRNRFFEQEFYDLQRIEVLRGPQGTLYGRNATAGVVNIISAKPKFNFEAKVSADLANYNTTRIEGMVNIPLVEDAVAVRLAGAWTKRDGYAFNSITGAPIDGRDLWSTRLSLRIAPVDAPFDVSLIWEHFEENDDRLRSGKQLCKTHITREVLGHPVEYPATNWSSPAAFLSQGCEATSFYAPESFQTPNGASVPYNAPLKTIFLPAVLFDPYVSRTQSRDLRVIESTVDPEYRAEAEVVELQASFDVTSSLTLTSETAYSTDDVFSLQDYNRFNTASGAWEQPEVAPNRPGVLQHGPNGGIFCDPQIGCADRLVLVDLSKAKSKTFSQEFRLGSDFDGPFNFSLGANYLRYDTEDKYYVFINSTSMISAISPFTYLSYGTDAMNYTDAPPYVAGVTDNIDCLKKGPFEGDATLVYPVASCTYIDPNPIDSLNDLGHNYFLSRNPYKLISYAVFGEAYYQLADNLKLTGGLRMTVDKKEAPEVPSWLLAGGPVGYSVARVSEQEWREPTGRLALDWKPDLAFTDETLLYASYAHGYKAGGANPPPFVRVFYSGGSSQNFGDLSTQVSATRPKAFAPEFIDAFELGVKNTLLDGRMTLNVAGFYYDYRDYQISEIVDRSAFNRNFDATVWGLEIEADWRPTENLRLGFKGGYENTRIADGEQAVDLMDRTAGNDDWIVVKPFPTLASNCILPKWLFISSGGLDGIGVADVGNRNGGTASACEIAYLFEKDPVTGLDYIANPPPGVVAPGNEITFASRPGYIGWDPETAPNNGEGFYKDLSGNELPNAPKFTATLTVDYTVPLGGDWVGTLHGDFYYQSESWWRIFNMEGYDKLKAYTNVNLSAILTNDDAGWKVMAYVKNVLDRDSITGAFLNSDDSGLTTNVFLNEPRLYGIRVTKEWTGGGLLGGFGGRGEGPYPFIVELGGQAQRHDAPYDPIAPSFSAAFSPTINSLDAAAPDLDWGDGREVKLTYAPGEWRLSVAARFGRTNTGVSRIYSAEPGDSACIAFKYPSGCSEPTAIFQATDWSEYDRAPQKEEHAVVDFAIGHDVGFGGAVSAGVRSARLTSRQGAHFYGIPDWDLTGGTLVIGSPGENRATGHRFDIETQADREFEGTGPMLAWDGSAALMGSDDLGRVALDWSVGGGVLFGKQTTTIEGEETVTAFSGNYLNPFFRTLQTPVVTPVAIHRSDSTTVRVVDVGLGLSYSLDRFKIGAGYRWERYFDAIDGGYDEAEDADRTIDGPYFKLSVGFGG